VKSNIPYWAKKIAGNRERDARHIEALQNAGWSVFVIWECEIGDPKRMKRLAKQIAAIHPAANSK